MLLRELYIPPKDAVEVENPKTGFSYKVSKKKARELVRKFGYKVIAVHHEEDDLDEGPTWARSGKKVVRKYRCSAGPRKNRIVSKLQQCFAAPNIKKRIALKRVKARLGSRITRKAKRTKRINPASIRVQRLNKAASRRR
tara:strand:+ start:431 stop:850 length:420 start_codon:yes stop_codon:yes gene_type:complete